MKITINARPHELDGPKLTHEQICALAGQPVHASVVYVGPKHGDSQRSGTTHVGKSIDLEDGMQIDCVVTSNA